MFEIGDIVILKEEHYLSRVVYGQWVIDDVRRKPFRPLSSTMIEYHIKTLNVNSDGSPSMTWVKTDDIISISKIRHKKLNELGIKEYQPHCYICYTMSVDEEMICDRCEEIYCDDCSYTFSLHYQHQGSRCYHCADQSRRTKLDKRDIVLNKVLLKEI